MKPHLRSLIGVSVVAVAGVLWRRWLKSKATTRLRLARIQGEYREMPGHALTVSQAARLWQLTPRTCQALLQALVDRKILEVTRDARYIMLRPS